MFRHTIGPDLELRLLEERHAAMLFELTDKSREHLRPWTPWLDSTKTEADSREFIRHSLGQFARNEGLVTGIWYKGSLAGVISFDRINNVNHSAMIGYWIGAEYQRKGLMTRACEALINYGFSELGLNRIVIWAATENLRSSAIPVRLGFTREGVERQAQWVNDHYVDIVVYSILRSEWKPR
jgi:ribosomal-protein-serine acetyltransferase